MQPLRGMPLAVVVLHPYVTRRYGLARCAASLVRSSRGGRLREYLMKIVGASQFWKG